MIVAAGGAMRATGWRATAIRFQQFGEGAALAIFVALTRARGAPRLTRSIWLSRLGGVSDIRCPHARARRAETDPLDLVEPPGRRCGNFFLAISF